MSLTIERRRQRVAARPYAISLACGVQWDDGAGNRGFTGSSPTGGECECVACYDGTGLEVGGHLRSTPPDRDPASCVCMTCGIDWRESHTDGCLECGGAAMTRVRAEPMSPTHRTCSFKISPEPIDVYRTQGFGYCPADVWDVRGQVSDRVATRCHSIAHVE